MPVSIVSKGVLKQMKLKYVPGKKEPVKDSRNVIYALVGQVDLRWHKEGQAKSYAETFYVVDQQTPLVILRYSAFEKSNKSAGGTIYPVGVQQQTAEENAILERKRQDAASRRAKEEQEQEENEAVSDAAKFAQEGAEFVQTRHTTIKASVERWKTPDLEAFKQLLAVLNDLGADIHRLQWIGWCFLALRASQPSYDWRIRLPAFVNKIRIGYVFREQTVEEKAVRRKVPAGKVTDNEVYQQLRPGVMVASELDAAHDTLSTSGVILEAPTGEKYLSVAKHGFQGGVGDLVYHPSRCGRVIGRVAKVFGETDIALAELADIRYSRETFSALDADVCPFGKILDTSELVIGDFVYLDTPFNGRCEGTLQRVEVARLPSDEPNEDTTYVVGIFAYI
ncbi:MAG: hypothetical protein LQ338_007480, partial [Usnochroma carphineum]